MKPVSTPLNTYEMPANMTIVKPTTIRGRKDGIVAILKIFEQEKLRPIDLWQLEFN